MTRRERYETIFQIVNRAIAMGIAVGDKITCSMDIDNADKQFDLRLHDFLSADDGNFAHDFCGIQRHIDRSTLTIGDFFVPRFAHHHRRYCDKYGYPVHNGDDIRLCGGTFGHVLCNESDDALYVDAIGYNGFIPLDDFKPSEYQVL